MRRRYPAAPAAAVAGRPADKPDEGWRSWPRVGRRVLRARHHRDLSATFARVADELHRQYAMGFSPEKLDGKTHKLEVRVNRPGMTARARSS